MSLLEEIRRDANGAAILSEWLGAGGVPVSQSLAESRASVCRTGHNGAKCPKNVEPGWWDRVKHKIADAIKDHLEVKNKMDLHTANEEQLGICRSCGCAMPLKVWVPIEHVAAHTTNEQYRDFEEFCWQRKEILKQ